MATDGLQNCHCRLTEIYYLWRPNLRDEADNHVLELAVAAGAQAIITNEEGVRCAQLRCRVCVIVAVSR
ncbi:MAG: PIN domain-containing protein [Rhodoferax sp.]|nr:PIN domain-containing protein [Rhodoferax sp.]